MNFTKTIAAGLMTVGLTSVAFAQPQSLKPTQTLPVTGHGEVAIQPDGTFAGIEWDGGHCRHDVWYNLNPLDENGNHRVMTGLMHYGNSVDYPNDCPNDPDWPSFQYYGLWCETQVPSKPNGTLIFESVKVPDCESDANISVTQFIPEPNKPGYYRVIHAGKRIAVHPNQCLQGNDRAATCEEAMGLVSSTDNPQ